MKKHWEKEIEVRDFKFKLKKLNPFEFSAFKMSYGRAFNEGDMKALSNAYEQITTWITYDSGVLGYVPVYNGTTFATDKFNEDPTIIAEVLDKVVTELLSDLLPDSEV